MPEYLIVEGRVLEEYWSNRFTKVSIVERPPEIYYVVEPLKLSEEEETELKNVLEELSFRLKPKEILDPQALENKLKELGIDGKLIYYVKAKVHGYDWLQGLMDDPRLEDIHCFCPGTPIRVVHRDYGLLKTNIVPGEAEVDHMVRLLAYRGGSSISLFKPVEDTVILPEGDRAALTYKSEVSFSSSFTIRKFPRNPWNPARMIRTGMITPEAMALLWLMLDVKAPIIIYGSMRTGKTSLVNSLISLISPESSIAIVQDAPEIRCFHENILYLYTSDRVGFEELAKLALRKSVDYLIVNEIRVREEAFWWSQLVCTGHGGLTTIHAESLEAVKGRLREFGVGESLLRSIRLALHTNLYFAEVDGRKTRVRRVDKVYFLDGSGIPDLIYDYERKHDRLAERSPDTLLKYLEKETGEDLGREWKIRTRFLTLASRATDRAEEFWALHVKFRRDPELTISELEDRFGSVSMKPKVVRIEEINYCPRCGNPLGDNSRVCLKCGFRLVV